MTNIDNDDHCPMCVTGTFVTRAAELDFLQWTDRGPVRCQVTILVAECVQCDYKTWGSEAEIVIAEAVRIRYDELK